MTQVDESIFTKIINREIPAEIEYENERFIVIHDISPAAPVHLLVIPKDPSYKDVVELAQSAPDLLAELVHIGKELANKLSGGEFRLVFNTGAASGQSVFHVHGHVLGNFEPQGIL
ncbi:MAG: HIT domain-containing protein [Microbacteriaceae bacterium]